MTCVICNKPIYNDQDPFIELTCSVHIAHGEHRTLRCPHPDCKNNAGKTPESIGTRQPQFEAPRVADPAAIQRKAQMAERDKEPLSPIASQPYGGIKAFFGNIFTKVSSAASGGRPARETDDPFVLLNARVPLKDVLVDEKGFCITALINDYGVTINDFFRNNYTIGQMCDAFPSRMNPIEGIDVLCALGMHEEHFRKLPKLAEIGVTQERLGYKPMDMVVRFGYRYRSPREGGWTLPELCSVGVTLPVAMRGGLQTLAQWEELKATMRDEKELEWFKATPEALAQLEQASAYNIQQYQTAQQRENAPLAYNIRQYQGTQEGNSAQPYQTAQAVEHYQPQVLYARPVSETPVAVQTENRPVIVAAQIIQAPTVGPVTTRARNVNLMPYTVAGTPKAEPPAGKGAPKFKMNR